MTSVLCTLKMLVQNKLYQMQMLFFLGNLNYNKTWVPPIYY
jgi:hypothetical protein